MVIINNNTIENKLISLFKFEQDIQQDIQQDLQNWHTQLKEALISSKAVIAGSAIMQSVLNVDWDDSDIDIWLPIDSQASPIDSFCKAIKILKCIPGHYYIPKIIKLCPRNRNYAFMPIETYQRLSTYVTYIMTMHHKNNLKKAIQIIFVKTTIEEVIASFDIIASQIWYNGKEFRQILPGQLGDNNIPMSEIIIDGVPSTNQIENPISQLINKTIQMSAIALELQSPFEWIRTIIRIEKYNTRFGATLISIEEKQSIVKSIIAKIDEQHATSPVTERSLRNMHDYLQNFKTAWNTNKSCKQQGIKVRWNNLQDVDVLEFKIEGITESFFTKPPPTPVLVLVTPVNEKKQWIGDTYVISNDNNYENANAPTTNVNLTIQQKSTCFDFCAYDDENIINYLDDDKDNNIVIFDASGEHPICYTRQRLTDLMNTASAVFYPCVSSDYPSTAIKEKTLVRIQLIYNVVVPISDVVEAIKNEVKIFRVYKTKTKFDRTKSANVEYNVHAAAMVSGDHCQAGTDKDLYRLLNAETFKSGGGKKMYTYNGLKYKLLNGTRGGKYIFVGEKKIYISEKDDLMNQIQNVRSCKANSIQAKKKSKKINK
jgi:hypothetical protein